MSFIQRFLLGNRVDDDLQVGLFLKNDGTVWLRNPDGSATQLPGGGGGNAVAVAFDHDPDNGVDTGYPLGALWLNDDAGTLWANNGDGISPVWGQIGALPTDNFSVDGNLAATNEFGSASLTTQGEGAGGLVEANVAVIQGLDDGTNSYLVSIRRGAVTSGDPGGDSWGVKLHGQEYLIALAAIDDGDVNTSERVQWYDDTSGAPKLLIKERDVDGTLYDRISAVLTADATAFAGISKPTVPATPLPQDIVDALVTLDLVIQAA